MHIFEAVVLAGGEDKRLNPLTSSDHPKCLLPVANSPMLMYSLRSLKQAGITSVFVVACGDVAASKVQKYVQKEPQLQSMTIKVVTAASESGSADAVRIVADRLIGDNVLVMSGDTVTDISLSTVLFTHSIRGAGITTVLSKNPTCVSAHTKAGKTPKGVDYVAIDQRSQRLLTYAYDPAQLRRISIPLTAIKACSSMTLTTNLRDACIYVLSKRVIDVLKDSSMSSIKVDGLPSIVNEQWTGSQIKEDAQVTPAAASPVNGADSLHEQAAEYLKTTCPDYRAPALGVAAGPTVPFCGVYLAEEGALCRRVNTLQSLLEANRELASVDNGQARAHVKELIHPSVEVAIRAVVGAGCIIGEQTNVGDKTSVKRSVVGAMCKIGPNVKIINSLVMDGCSIGDGAYIQNSIIGWDVSVGAKGQLKDCHVGSRYKVPDNADHRDEQLAVKVT